MKFPGLHFRRGGAASAATSDFEALSESTTSFKLPSGSSLGDSLTGKEERDHDLEQTREEEEEEEDEGEDEIIGSINDKKQGNKFVIGDGFCSSSSSSSNNNNFSDQPDQDVLRPLRGRTCGLEEHEGDGTQHPLPPNHSLETKKVSKNQQTQRGAKRLLKNDNIVQSSDPEGVTHVHHNERNKSFLQLDF